MKLAFVWHWQKKTTPALNGAFAAEDTLISAIARLAEEGHEALIFAIGERECSIFSERQKIQYRLFVDRQTLLQGVQSFQPDVVVLNHNPKDYDDVLQSVAGLPARKALFFAASITDHPIARGFDAFFVHHEFQKRDLAALGYEAEKIFVAPKTADLSRFGQLDGKDKLWDCIYPSRGGFGYLKRIELAVEACRRIGKTIIVPGGSIADTLSRPARPARGPVERWLPSVLRRRLERFGLAGYPWVTTTRWALPEELNLLYNKSRCMVITTNDKEMGPRVIPEAAACNLPIVCCSDSRACVSHAERLGGFIAKPEPADVAKKIEMALSEASDTRQRLLENGMDTWVIYRGLQAAFSSWNL